jgi:hypothetical protein
MKCVWEYKTMPPTRVFYYWPSCARTWKSDLPKDNTCHVCGKKIEVKEG